MTQRVRWIALLGVCLLTALPSVATDDLTMTGGFVWEREDGNHEGELKAVFTSAGDDEWDVKFHFDWEDGPHVYSGTISGMMSGDFTGKVKADGDREQWYTISGTGEGTTLNGVANFVTKEGEEKRAGTFTLSK